MLSNMSKTFQAGLIRRFGFGIPETIVTNDPDQVIAFVEQCAAEGDEVVYKSVSGTRSIVQTFGEQDRARLSRVRWCPTQFQRRVRGTDIRVHVVGSQIFATRIESTATDYRYSLRQSGEDAVLTETRLPQAVSTACFALSAALDLPFVGIDLRVTPDNEFVCFEANPSPAYSYYEGMTGAPIAQALVHWLAGHDRRAS
jgi:glutathione synthase/RimK-type ligase-like ATP-grasp enzyme